MATKPWVKLLQVKEKSPDDFGFTCKTSLCDLDRANQYPGAAEFLSYLER